MLRKGNYKIQTVLTEEELKEIRKESEAKGLSISKVVSGYIRIGKAYQEKIKEVK